MLSLKYFSFREVRSGRGFVINALLSAFIFAILWLALAFLWDTISLGPDDERPFPVAIFSLIVAVPVIYICHVGLLTVQRLNDLSLPRWFVVVFLPAIYQYSKLVRDETHLQVMFFLKNSWHEFALFYGAVFLALSLLKPEHAAKSKSMLVSSVVQYCGRAQKSVRKISLTVILVLLWGLSTIPILLDNLGILHGESGLGLIMITVFGVWPATMVFTIIFVLIKIAMQSDAQNEGKFSIFQKFIFSIAAVSLIVLVLIPLSMLGFAPVGIVTFETMLILGPFLFSLFCVLAIATWLLERRFAKGKIKS